MAPARSDYFKLIQTEIWTFQGPDALRFLNGISTPHLSRAVPNESAFSGRGMFLDPKGKLLAPFVFIKDSSTSIRLRLDVGCHTRRESMVELNQSLYDHICGIIIADDLNIHRQPIQIMQCWSSEIAAKVSSLPLPSIKPQAQDLLFVAGVYQGNACLPVSYLGANAFELWPNGNDVPLPCGVELGDEQFAQKLFEARYLEFPNQLRVGDLPLEFGFRDAISFFKGCYRGQEIIARVTYRGKLVKALCQLEFAAPIDVLDTQLMGTEDQIVGEIRVLSGDRRSALALLRFDAVDGVATASGKIAVSKIHRLVTKTNEHFR